MIEALHSIYVYHLKTERNLALLVKNIQLKLYFYWSDHYKSWANAFLQV